MNTHLIKHQFAHAAKLAQSAQKDLDSMNLCNGEIDKLSLQDAEQILNNVTKINELSVNVYVLCEQAKRKFKS